ncbi:Protein-tyrosine phosphatase, partial [Opisthorchis viverrini]
PKSANPHPDGYQVRVSSIGSGGHEGTWSDVVHTHHTSPGSAIGVVNLTCHFIYVSQQRHWSMQLTWTQPARLMTGMHVGRLSHYTVTYGQMRSQNRRELSVQPTNDRNEPIVEHIIDWLQSDTVYAAVVRPMIKPTQLLTQDALVDLYGIPEEVHCATPKTAEFNVRPPWVTQTGVTRPSSPNVRIGCAAVEHVSEIKNSINPVEYEIMAVTLGSKMERTILAQWSSVQVSNAKYRHVFHIDLSKPILRRRSLTHETRLIGSRLEPKRSYAITLKACTKDCSDTTLPFLRLQPNEELFSSDTVQYKVNKTCYQSLWIQPVSLSLPPPVEPSNAQTLNSDPDRLLWPPQSDGDSALNQPPSDDATAHGPESLVLDQGPLPQTVGDFWRMVWEQRSAMIVSMTRLEERARIKCEQYWPGNGSTLASPAQTIIITNQWAPNCQELMGEAQYGDITVGLLDTIELAYYTIRTFILHKTGTTETREVRQLQFTAWPDHGVPNHPAPLLMFLRRVRAECPSDSGPIVVHCSAGVGRTGAFILLDILLEQMRHEKAVDVFSTVSRLRAQRNFMVQTEDQYAFVYEALVEAAASGNTELPVRQLEAHWSRLTKPNSGLSSVTSEGSREDSTGLALEFSQLVAQSQLTTGSSLVPTSVNLTKNRHPDFVPHDANRVALRAVRGVDGSDYINASYIDGYRSRAVYIATQAPLTSTLEDFWRMIWETGSCLIVRLESLPCYNDPRSMDLLTCTFLSSTAFVLTLSPSSSLGAGRTGVFLAIAVALERMRYEGVVDMFQTVKLLRWQRVGLVQTASEYAFCYAAALEYLESFERYVT